MTTTPTFGQPSTQTQPLIAHKPFATFIMGMKNAATQTECDPIFEAYLDYKNAYNELNIKMQETERANERLSEKYEIVKFRQKHDPVTFKRQYEDMCEEVKNLRRRNNDLIDALKTMVREY